MQPEWSQCCAGIMFVDCVAPLRILGFLGALPYIYQDLDGRMFNLPIGGDNIMVHQLNKVGTGYIPVILFGEFILCVFH